MLDPDSASCLVLSLHHSSVFSWHHTHQKTNDRVSVLQLSIRHPFVQSFLSQVPGLFFVFLHDLIKYQVPSAFVAWGAEQNSFFNLLPRHPPPYSPRQDSSSIGNPSRHLRILYFCVFFPFFFSLVSRFAVQFHAPDDPNFAAHCSYWSKPSASTLGRMYVREDSKSTKLIGRI